MYGASAPCGVSGALRGAGGAAAGVREGGARGLRGLRGLRIHMSSKVIGQDPRSGALFDHCDAALPGAIS